MAGLTAALVALSPSSPQATPQLALLVRSVTTESEEELLIGQRFDRISAARAVAAPAAIDVPKSAISCRVMGPTGHVVVCSGSTNATTGCSPTDVPAVNTSLADRSSSSVTRRSSTSRPSRFASAKPCRWLRPSRMQVAASETGTLATTTGRVTEVVAAAQAARFLVRLPARLRVAIG